MAFRFGADPATITLVRTVLETLSEKANVAGKVPEKIFLPEKEV